MTKNTNDHLELAFPNNFFDGALPSERQYRGIPDLYRLVRFRTEDGQIHLKLQGYFTWTQGRSQRGGEWRDIETVDADDLSDDKPYGHLY